jgi:hypothetical protein
MHDTVPAAILLSFRQGVTYRRPLLQGHRSTGCQFSPGGRTHCTTKVNSYVSLKACLYLSSILGTSFQRREFCYFLAEAMSAHARTGGGPHCDQYEGLASASHSGRHTLLTSIQSRGQAWWCYTSTAIFLHGLVFNCLIN